MLVPDCRSNYLIHSCVVKMVFLFLSDPSLLLLRPMWMTDVVKCIRCFRICPLWMCAYNCLNSDEHIVKQSSHIDVAGSEITFAAVFSELSDCELIILCRFCVAVLLHWCSLQTWAGASWKRDGSCISVGHYCFCVYNCFACWSGCSH